MPRLIMHDSSRTAETPRGSSWGGVFLGSFLLAFVVLFFFKDFNLYTYDPRFGEYRLKETAQIPTRLFLSFAISGLLALLNSISIYVVNVAIRAMRRRMSKHTPDANHEMPVSQKR